VSDEPIASSDGARTDAAVADLTQMRTALDRALESFVDEELAHLPPKVAESVRYAVLSPGKRVRPLLLMAAYGSVGGTQAEIVDLGLSVELVHAYSLVHDDLPCMDDDVIRAIIRGCENLGVEQRLNDRLVSTLATASGASGMVGGQLLDLRAEGRRVTRDELERIHTGKTARLIAAAAMMGGIAADAEPRELEALRRFGLDLGLAFQAVDDILDMRGTAGELGKESGRDMALRKATYPALFGISHAFAEAAIAELDALDRPEGLEAIASYVIERTH